MVYIVSVMVVFTDVFLFFFFLSFFFQTSVQCYTKRRQIMAKVTEWFFYYFLIFKLVMVAKLKFPTFPQSKSLVNPEENQQKATNLLISIVYQSNLLYKSITT